MSLTKAELTEKIYRRLGYPVVKVELDPQQIIDNIDHARSKWIKWAVGNSTQEVFLTKLLSAGEFIYDLPAGVVDIVSYSSKSASQSGVNTLFTVDNFLYNEGIYESLVHTGGDGYNLVSYHIALDFLETVKRYTVDIYNWKYHKYTNQLEIHPCPPSGGSITYTDEDGESKTIDSPGWVLLQTYMIEGSSLGGGWASGDSDEDFYGEYWILDYATALSKINLGLIRRKFANYTSIGNVGISLDGDSLVSEGKEEKDALDESLKLEESYTGYGITMG